PRAPPRHGPRGRPRVDRRGRAGRGDARRDPPAQARAAPGAPPARTTRRTDRRAAGGHGLRVHRGGNGAVVDRRRACFSRAHVLARSAFHHSLNYRSVVILGTAAEVTDQAERLAALEAIVEHVVPGRWREVRGPSERELKLTKVLSLPIAEASAKVRTGGPLDD